MTSLLVDTSVRVTWFHTDGETEADEAQLIRLARVGGRTRHGLAPYDASWEAAAVQLDIALVSADRQLLESGLAESATQTVARLRL